MTVFGVYTHNLDSKSRVFVPARYRAELGESFVVFPGPDGCLFAYPIEVWNQKIVAAMKNSKTPQERARQRRLFGSAQLLEADKQGRVTLSKTLLDAVGIEGSALFAGVDQRIEIWAPDRYYANISVDDDADLASLYPEIDY